MSSWILLIMLTAKGDSGMQSSMLKMNTQKECQRVGDAIVKHYASRSQWLLVDTFCVEIKK